MLLEEYFILKNEEKIMLNTTLRITAFSLLSLLATASVQASQINQEGLRLVPTNTVLEGAPLYAVEETSTEEESTQFYTSATAVEGELFLLPTNTVLEGEALYSYQTVTTEQISPATESNLTEIVAQGELRLLPTNSVLEGAPLYSYQRVVTKNEDGKVYADTKANEADKKTNG